MDGHDADPMAMQVPDSGAAALARLLRFLEVPASAEQIGHESGRGGGPIDDMDLVRAARRAGLKARLVRPAAKRLSALPLSLDRTGLQVDGRPQALGTGMMVTAEIKTGRRRLIDYLLSPVMRRGAQSLHER